MKIINNRCSNCGYDGVEGWLLSSPVQCPDCGQSEESHKSIEENLLKAVEDKEKK